MIRRGLSMFLALTLCLFISSQAQAAVLPLPGDSFSAPETGALPLSGAAQLSGAASLSGTALRSSVIPEGYDMTVPSTQPEPQLVWDILMEGIGNEIAVAGIMGNLSLESLFYANNLEDIYNEYTGLSDEEYTAQVDNGTYSRYQFVNDEYGYGLAQWTYDILKADMYDYVKENGYSIGNTAAQAQFLLYSLEKYYPGLLIDLRAATSIYEATVDFLVIYENPLYQNSYVRNARSLEAHYYYNLYTGWVEKGGLWYYWKPGEGYQTGWMMDQGIWYYFNDAGVMQTGWQQVNGTWYYLAQNGVMLTGWQPIQGSWYYLAQNGAMLTGWLQSNGAWYYLAQSGAMQTGWRKIDNDWYFFSTSGAMASGEWCDGYWLSANGKWIYKYTASWKENSVGRWYQDTYGWYPKDTTIRIDGKLYSFDESGYLIQ